MHTHNSIAIMANGQFNYNQEFEFDRHRMSYDSNLERDEYPQQYDHEYYGQSNYNQ
jgi:hypothetical protein